MHHFELGRLSRSMISSSPKCHPVNCLLEDAHLHWTRKYYRTDKTAFSHVFWIYLWVWLWWFFTMFLLSSSAPRNKCRLHLIVFDCGLNGYFVIWYLVNSLFCCPIRFLSCFWNSNSCKYAFVPSIPLVNPWIRFINMCLTFLICVLFLAISSLVSFFFVVLTVSSSLIHSARWIPLCRGQRRFCFRPTFVHSHPIFDSFSMNLIFLKE